MEKQCFAADDDDDDVVIGVPGTYQMAINPNDNAIWILDTRDASLGKIGTSGRNEGVILAAFSGYVIDDEDYAEEVTRQDLRGSTDLRVNHVTARK